MEASRSTLSTPHDACAFLVSRPERRCVHVAVLRPVTPDDCASCSYYTGQFRGLGDIVHSVAVATGIAAVVKWSGVDCGCGKRRAALNAALPQDDKGTGT